LQEHKKFYDRPENKIELFNAGPFTTYHP